MGTSIDLHEDRSVRVTVGELLEVRLLEQSGGGYLWSRVGVLPAGLSEVAQHRIPGESGVGAASTRVFVFSCTAEAIVDLHFTLARPWQPDRVEEERVLHAVCVRK